MTKGQPFFVSLFVLSLLVSSSEISPSLASSSSILAKNCSSHYEILPMKSFHLRGGWTKECQPYYVSYESCLLLLENSSPSCRAAYYVHKVCHLLDQNSIDKPLKENLNLNQDEIDGIYIKKLKVKNMKECYHQEGKTTPPIESGTASNPTGTAGTAASVLEVTAIESYQQCALNPSASPQYRTPANYEQLPRLNIVISASLSWKSKNVKEFSHAIAHWRCYAKIHNYNFTLNMIPSKNPADFFVSR
jgi:hypothetical protein